MNIRNEKGSTIILFALVITVIIGFVGLAVDFGYAVLKDLQLTNAIDAATLAAAQDLLESTSAATDTAHEYLQKNGIDPNMVTITFSDSNHSIRLEASTTVDNRFMRVLGKNTTGIGAAAKATINPMTKSSGGIKPFGVEDGSFEYGDLITLKTGDSTSEDYGSGNFGALALGGSGLSNLLDNVEFGYDGPVAVGDLLDTEPGNMAAMLNPIKKMIADDDTEYTDYGIDSMPEDSIRLWVVPIVDSFQVNGKNVVEVVGFSVFFVEDIGKQGGQTSLTGRFVRSILPGEIGTTQEDYGAYAAKLVE